MLMLNYVGYKTVCLIFQDVRSTTQRTKVLSLIVDFDMLVSIVSLVKRNDVWAKVYHIEKSYIITFTLHKGCAIN